LTRLDRLLALDYDTNLPDRLLVKVDRASMAHSLEVRSPFLDHEVVEFAARIPSRHKRRGGDGKRILKRAFQDVLPQQVLDRPKAGFGVSIDSWIRGPLKETAASSPSGLGDRPTFDGRRLRQLLNDHLDRRADNGNVIWDLVVLERWYEEYIDG
jgi:asparagine synthase (glutamine-hydrolysing)